jgi:outer membrane protein
MGINPKIEFNLRLILMKHFLFIISFFTYFIGFAQKSTVLEKYIQSGLQSNLALKEQDLDLKKSLLAIEQAKGLFKPTLTFAANYTRAVGGRKIDLPVGDLLNPVYNTLNQLTQTNNFPNIGNVKLPLLPDNFQETKFKVAYPIYNVDLRLNKLVQEQTLLTKKAQKAVLEQELRLQISEAYLNYLKATEAEKIYLNAKIVLNELLRFNQSLVKNNVATKEIISTAEYEITKIDNEIYGLKTTQNTAQSYLNFLINRDFSEQIIIDTLLLKYEPQLLEKEQVIQNALKTRKEFEVINSGINMVESVVKTQELSKKRPSVYIGSEFGFQGFGYKFNKDQLFVLAQIGLTYNIFDGKQLKTKTQMTLLEKEKLQLKYTEVERQIALQMTQQYNEYDAALNNWRTSKKGVVAAESIFKIVNSKYRASQALLLEFLEAQNRVTTAKMQVLLALIEVEIKIRKLDFND